MRVKKVLHLAFLAFCVAGAGLVMAVRRPPQRSPMQGFTLYITQTSYPSAGAPIQTATKVRQQRSDGSWKVETTYSNGRIDIGYGEPGRGIFALDQKKQNLEYLSASSGRPLADVDWTTQAGYAGEETILGFKTYRIHSENGDNYSDSYMCPALQGYPLRLVSGNAHSKTVFEVTRVVLGEPVFERAPDLPVDTSRFLQKSEP